MTSANNNPTAFDICLQPKGVPGTVVAAETGAFARMVGHLEQLKRALEREGVTAVVNRRGQGSFVELQVAGLSSGITCRNNPQDAGHWWYFQAGKPLVAAGDAVQVREATETIQGLRAARRPGTSGRVTPP